MELVFVWRDYSSKMLVYLLDIGRDTSVIQSRDIGYTTLVQYGRRCRPVAAWDGFGTRQAGESSRVRLLKVAEDVDDDVGAAAAHVALEGEAGRGDCEDGVVGPDDARTEVDRARAGDGLARGERAEIAV